MSRYLLIIEYDGSPYNGWQFQKNQTTVMGTLMNACQKVFETQKFELYGAGRTDAGVHALGQVAHLDVNTSLRPEAIKIKLNDILPATLNLKNVKSVDSKFHARYDAKARSYVYHISTRRTAFGKKYAYWIKDKLDVMDMQKAAKVFVGMHDYKSFGSAEAENQSTKVEILHVGVHQQASSILVHIVGSHFLWKMVRRMVGTLIECGRGNINETDIRKMLNHYSDIPAKLTVPPSGLFLEKVYYSSVPETFVPVWPMVIDE
ncbi:MAG: tRNA pseudouridine(38-40) synthase TruA [Bacteroidales bacterium]|nr:tRNA pseudouridine(38-40) synthase TruA [Bacteroidales bacterium]